MFFFSPEFCLFVLRGQGLAGHRLDPVASNEFEKSTEAQLDLVRALDDRVRFLDTLLDARLQFDLAVATISRQLNETRDDIVKKFEEGVGEVCSLYFVCLFVYISFFV